MPWPETTVPKFGDWDGNEDLSYSIVFDKARADKERFLPTLKDGSKDAPLPGLTAGKRAPHTSLNKTVESGSRIPAHDSPKLSSRHGGQTSTDEQRNSNNLQVDPWNSSDKGSVYGSSMPSSGQQPTQIGSTKETKTKEMGVRNNGSHVGGHQAFYGGMHRIPGQDRQMHQGYPAAPKSTRSQRSSESSSTADMPEKIVVPRFGEWDASDAKAGEGFTMIFDRARDEKKSKTALKTPPTKFISPHRPDEDLYKDSQARKKKGGWLNTLCCVDIDDGKG